MTELPCFMIKNFPFHSTVWRNNRHGDDRDLTLEDWLLIFIEFFLWNCDFTLEDRMPVFIESMYPKYVRSCIVIQL